MTKVRSDGPIAGFSGAMGEIIQCLMIALIVVIVHEACDSALLFPIHADQDSTNYNTLSIRGRLFIIFIARHECEP